MLTDNWNLDISAPKIGTASVKNNSITQSLVLDNVCRWMLDCIRMRPVTVQCCALMLIFLIRHVGVWNLHMLRWKRRILHEHDLHITTISHYRPGLGLVSL